MWLGRARGLRGPRCLCNIFCVVKDNCCGSMYLAGPQLQQQQQGFLTQDADHRVDGSVCLVGPMHIS